MSVQRAKAAHRRDPSLNFSTDDTMKPNETRFTLNSKERKKLLKEFVLKKKLEWKKSLNKEKKYEFLLMGQEIESKLADEFLKYDDEEDYSEEFDRSSSYSEEDNYRS